MRPKNYVVVLLDTVTVMINNVDNSQSAEDLVEIATSAISQGAVLSVDGHPCTVECFGGEIEEDGHPLPPDEEE